MATSQGGYVNGGFDLLKAPDAPTITSVETSIGSVSVAFTAPANPGGSAVTGYTVTAIDESTGASVGATGSASPISISTSSGTFKVRAAATNIYGPGRVSEFDTGNVVQYSGASLWGWGRNNYAGPIGDNTIINRSSPVQVGALTTWAYVSSGGYVSGAIKTDGTLWTWGSGADGALGNGTVINRSSPVQVGALTDWSRISTSTACAAVKTDGTLWTWGSNGDGRLGNGTVINRSSPVQVGALTNWRQVSVGSNHAASVKTDGTLWSWGGGGDGKLGDNTIISRSSPVQVGTLTNWAQVTAARDQTLAVKTDGTLWAWGNNYRGVLGLNLPVATNRSSPVQVGALTNWAQVSTGFGQTVCVKTDNTLWTWGHNNNGQLGQGNSINRSSPIQVGALTDWAQGVAGFNWSSARKTDGTVWTWGDNSTGPLGDGTVISRSSPVQVGALTGWVQIDGRASNGIALYGVT
jgi:alpha-tubulin suppressor-like RCC1 family protein